MTGVEFRNVSFSFGDNPANQVLRGVSFTAEPGRTTALVGRSGGGKTTILNLILRIFDIQSGEILLGGKNIQRMQIAELRQQFALVSQDPGIFDETVAENIRIGRRDATDEQLLRAADAACVTDFLPNLPEDFQLPCGPRGSSLSGGQRQRIAIARALIRDAPVLLLDEPTAALDKETETRVREALRGKTAILVTHSVAVMRGADQIYVIEDGKAVGPLEFSEVVMQHDFD